MNITTRERLGLTRPLRILSIEDDDRALRGPLARLARDGHLISEVREYGDAERPLHDRPFDLLFVDERLGGSLGSDLVLALKRGVYGACNLMAAFVMVTANEMWPPRQKIEPLAGYHGIKRKGSTLTRDLKATIHEIRETPPPPGPGRLRRVVARVVSCGEGSAGWVDLAVPSWRTTDTVRVARERLPGAAYIPNEQFLGSHYFAWMNLDAETAETTDMTSFRPEMEDSDVDRQS